MLIEKPSCWWWAGSSPSVRILTTCYAHYEMSRYAFRAVMDFRRHMALNIYPCGADTMTGGRFNEIYHRPNETNRAHELL